MSEQNQPTGIKVVLLGDAAAGKSSLLMRYTTGQFNPLLDSTIGAAFKSKVITKGDKCVRLDIWDTAGQERYRSILPMYYRNATAAILVVDVTERQTLKVADRWIMDIRQKTDNADCFIILAVNKIDVSERRMSNEEVTEFCLEKGIEFIETSAKSGYNVAELFDRVCECCLGIREEVPTDVVIPCEKPKEVAKKGCC